MRRRLDTKKYTVIAQSETKITEFGPETRMQDWRLVNPPELPPEWSLLIGDFAANARSALDHLAWQLALRNTWRASRERKAGNEWPPEDTEFPIYASISKARTAKRLKTKLNRFRPSGRSIVASVQPHTRGNLAHTEPLWMLHRIRNTDAHRTLHTVLAGIPLNVLFNLIRFGTADPDVRPPATTEEMEKFVASLNEGDILQSTYKVEADFSPYVTFDQRGADFHGQEVLPLLNRCRDEVERILGLFSPS
jgi:hypothetical protein